MGIRDRGKMKWQSAFFMPEQMKMIREARREDLKVSKPILDEYQIEEFEEKILLAMEFANQVKLKVWIDGFVNEYIGFLHRLDEFHKVIYLEDEDGEMKKVRFSDVVGVQVIGE